MNVPEWFRILCWAAPADDELLQAIFLGGIEGWDCEKLRPNRGQRILIV